MEGKSHLRFAKLAPFYDLGVRLCGFMLGGEERVRRRVVDLLPLRGNEQILEVGCGTGTVTLMLSRRLQQEGRAFGVDPSPQMLIRAQRKLRSDPLPAMFLQGSGDQLPFVDSSLDCVVCFLSLHEMSHPDRIAALQESVRVLKPDGYLLIGELHRPSSPVGKFLLRLLLLVEEEEARDFFQRGLDRILREAAGNRLHPVTNSLFAGGLGQGLLLRKRAA